MAIKDTHGDGRHNSEVRYLPALLAERNVAPDLRRAPTWIIGGLLELGRAESRALRAYMTMPGSEYLCGLS